MAHGGIGPQIQFNPLIVMFQGSCYTTMFNINVRKLAKLINQ